MKGTIEIVNHDQKIELKIIELIEPIDLKFLQENVEGPIEQIPFFKFHKTKNGLVECVAFCNEEGKFNGLPFNVDATEMWTNSIRHINAIEENNIPLYFDVLCGTIVIVYGDDEFMQSL